MAESERGDSHGDQSYTIEIWSDSFKEGEWAAELLLGRGGLAPQESREYVHGFRPRFRASIGDDESPLLIDVFGDYDAWSDRPEAVSDALQMGKPDVMLYSPLEDRILLGIEETAAVPTGNQSLQRLERVWWAAEQGIPFVYIMPEYGMHKDGGVRTTSIWPAYLASKLSMQYGIVSVTLMFGDREHPEDYSYGIGMSRLQSLMLGVLSKVLAIELPEASLPDTLFKIYKEMGEFIDANRAEISLYLPGEQLLTDRGFLQTLVESVIE